MMMMMKKKKMFIFFSAGQRNSITLMAAAAVATLAARFDLNLTITHKKKKINFFKKIHLSLFFCVEKNLIYSIEGVCG